MTGRTCSIVLIFLIIAGFAYVISNNSETMPKSEEELFVDWLNKNKSSQVIAGDPDLRKKLRKAFVELRKAENPEKKQRILQQISNISLEAYRKYVPHAARDKLFAFAEADLAYIVHLQELSPQYCYEEYYVPQEHSMKQITAERKKIDEGLKAKRQSTLIRAIESGMKTKHPLPKEEDVYLVMGKATSRTSEPVREWFANANRESLGPKLGCRPKIEVFKEALKLNPEEADSLLRVLFLYQ